MLRLIGLGWFSRSGVVWCGGSGGVTVRAHDAGGELDVGFVLHLSVHMGRLYVRGCWFFFVEKSTLLSPNIVKVLFSTCN